jgi:hypothetical protein
MKNPVSQTKKVNTKFNTNKSRAEIRNELDNRQNEEQDFKGDDITHNQKELKNKNKQPGKKPKTRF